MLAFRPVQPSPGLVQVRHCPSSPARDILPDVSRREARMTMVDELSTLVAKWRQRMFSVDRVSGV
jgi:hypothetical protein